VVYAFLEGAELYILLGIVLIVALPVVIVVLLVRWSKKRTAGHQPLNKAGHLPPDQLAAWNKAGDATDTKS
jgi:hypothetical protein